MNKSIELLEEILGNLEKYKDTHPHEYLELKNDIEEKIEFIKNNDYTFNDEIIEGAIARKYKFLEEFGVSFIEGFSCSNLDFLSLNLSKRYAKLMEHLYLSDDYIVGLHATGNRSEDVYSSFLTKGIYSSRGPKISTTVHLFDKERDTFNNFILYNHIPMITESSVIVAIPKSDFNSGMWKEDNDNYYLNPKYVVGIIEDMHKGVEINSDPNIILNEKSCLLSDDIECDNDEDYIYKDEYLSMDTSKKSYY